MPLGSHVARRRAAGILDCSTSTPRAPLLFLYPSWPVHQPNTHGKLRRALSGSQIIGIASTIRQSRHGGITDHNADRRGRITPARRLQTLGPKASRLSQRKAFNTLSSHKSTATVTQSETFTHPGVDIPSPPSSVEPSNNERATNIQQPLRIRRIRESRAINARDRAFVNRHKMGMVNMSLDWRRSLAALERATPRTSRAESTHTGYIYVPAWLVDHDLNLRRELMHIISKTYGCVLSSFSNSSNGQKGDILTLTGSQRSIQMVWRALLDIASGSRDHQDDMPSISRSPSNPQARFISYVSTRQKIQCRPEKIPFPRKVSGPTIIWYIYQLTNCDPSYSLHRKLYQHGEYHVRKVATILEKLFTSPEIVPHITHTAFRFTLEYLVRTNQIACARRIFFKFEQTHTILFNDVFNIMLRGTGKAKNLQSFNFILKLMIKRGFRTDGLSWNAFLMVNESHDVRMMVVKKMRARQLFSNPVISQDSAALIAPQELVKHLDQGHSLDRFFQHMDEVFGKEWMSISTLNPILREISGRGLFQESLKALEIFKSRNIRPKTASINSILHPHTRHEHLIALLELFERENLRPTNRTFVQLFRWGWKAQYYNTCRVIWRYACILACADWELRQPIKKSLMLYPLHQGSAGKVWLSTAGHVITGIMGSSTPTIRAAQVELAQVDHKAPEEIDLRKRLVHDIVETDLNTFTTCYPRVRFTTLLKEALLKDREWIDGGRWDEMAVRWKMKYAIHVPIRPRNRLDVEESLDD